MMHAQLWQWLKDSGITQTEAAHRVGYTVNYLNAVLNGNDYFSPALRFTFVEAYPETAVFLLPKLDPQAPGYSIDELELAQ